MEIGISDALKPEHPLFSRNSAQVLKLLLKLIVTFSGALSTSLGFANTAANDFNSRLDEIVQRYHQRHLFHGNVVVATSKRVLFEKSIGLANEEWKVPHSLQSRFLIASLTKQFTAAAVLLLEEEGLIRLTDPIEMHLQLEGINMKAENRAKWVSLTIEDLLVHRGGLIRDIEQSPSGSPQIYEPNASATLRRMLSEVSVFFTKDFDAGIYSNFGYFILAVLVEKVSGQSFHSFLQQRIFNPLQMGSTGGYHEMKVIPNLAEGYHLSDGMRSRLLRRCCADLTSYLGSHDLYSDAYDLLKWMRALASGDGRVISQRVADALFTPRHPLMDSEGLYGYGFMIDEFGGVRRIWHSGKEAGYTSVLSYLPEEDAMVVLLSNRSPHNDGFSEAVVTKMHNEITMLFNGHDVVSQP